MNNCKYCGIQLTKYTQKIFCSRICAGKWSGENMTDELKNKIRIMHSNKIVSEETRKKMSIAKHNFKPWNFGMKGEEYLKHYKGGKMWMSGKTKETNEKIRLYSIKLSLIKTKNRKYDKCVICNKDKGLNTRNRCIYCAAKFRAEHYINGMKGRKLSEEHKFKLLSSWKNHHTKPELEVLNSFIGLKYVGDGKLWLKLKNGKWKNPDIIFNNYKIAIEVFGDYWHKNDNPQDLINEYNKIGWKCLILWENEILALSKQHLLVDTIDRFINYDNYEPYISSTEENYGMNYNSLSNEIRGGLI